MPFCKIKRHYFPSFWIISSFLISSPSSFLPTILKVILSTSLFLTQTLSITLLSAFGYDLATLKMVKPLNKSSPPLITFCKSDWANRIVGNSKIAIKTYIFMLKLLKNMAKSQ